MSSANDQLDVGDSAFAQVSTSTDTGVGVGVSANVEVADDEGFLEACLHRYDALLATAITLHESGSPELALDWVQMTANFAAMHHPGRFADGALENIALDVGRRLVIRPDLDSAIASRNHWQPRTEPATRRVLHVATTIASIGGHTRTILNWIANDADSEHSLVTTDSLGVNVPPALRDAIEASGGQLVVLSCDAPLTDRACWLRQWSAANADLVFLHVVPHDVVPVAAFACEGGPAVALINLADQCYWLGSTIADSVVHLREVGVSTSREVRFTRHDLLLPIPMTETLKTLGKHKARASLRIPNSQMMLLSVGRSIKYAPSRRHNFFRTACKILDQNPAAHLYVVGVGEQDYAAHTDFQAHERMHLLGPVADATVHQRAADVYIEGFPFGSQTALLESVMSGTPCVTAVEQGTPLLATQDVALNDLVETPVDEAAYVVQVSAFIDDPDLRGALGARLRERVLSHHVGNAWISLLHAVYENLGALTHRPQHIPPAQGQHRPIDRAISGYHGTRRTGTDSKAFVDAQAVEMIRMSAYFLRERGFYLDSLRLLVIAARQSGWDRESSLYVAKLLPHKMMRWVRKLKPPEPAARHSLATDHREY